MQIDDCQKATDAKARGCLIESGAFVLPPIDSHQLPFSTDLCADLLPFVQTRHLSFTAIDLSGGGLIWRQSAHDAELRLVAPFATPAFYVRSQYWCPGFVRMSVDHGIHNQFDPSERPIFLVHQ